MRKSLIALLGFALTGCATLPRVLQKPGVAPVSIAEAQGDHTPLGVPVRWGGMIATIHNGKTHTWMEIVQQPLAKDGRPRRTDRTEGRFLARFDGFLDPAIYAKRRKITVVGTLGHTEVRLIGRFSYTFPVVKVTGFHLWQPLPKQQPAYSSPFWGDPWDPWGPFF